MKYSLIVFIITTIAIMHFTCIARLQCNIIVDFMLLVALNRFDCLDCRHGNLFLVHIVRRTVHNLSFLWVSVVCGFQLVCRLNKIHSGQWFFVRASFLCPAQNILCIENENRSKNIFLCRAGICFFFFE